jgi:hypothetical protein
LVPLAVHLALQVLAVQGQPLSAGVQLLAALQ